MNVKIVKKHHSDDLHASGLAFWMISLMHDNPLLPLLKDPCKLLKTAGLRHGQKVLEVGCGPGFFTVPAAKIVGREGIIYAADINHRAIKRVEEKVRKYGIGNIKPILGNAANSDLQAHCPFGLGNSLQSYCIVQLLSPYTHYITKSLLV